MGEEFVAVAFTVTLVGSVVRSIIGYLFSFAIVRFGQEWIAKSHSGPGVTVFDVSLLSAFRNQTWVWGVDEWKLANRRSRPIPLLLVATCILGFALVPSGTAGLIAPTTFNRTVVLKGREINFMPSDVQCLPWLEANQIGSNCDWKVRSSCVSFSGML